ncbi:MAG: ADP-glyceromanno-heptose 6-epimerase [Proteobacteria bacterium]|nr:ADP-glyceromanno-heptose 6-epimerase [Pseudomonadota bacterium]
MIIVTGGAGFIGSNLVAALARQQGRRVTVVDHLGDDAKWQNLAKSDVTDIVAPDDLFEFLEQHPDHVEAIFHLGAISSTTETDVDLILDINFRLSLKIWAWCAATNTPLIYASSAATYGDGDQGFDDDGDLAALGLLRPMNPYGWSKHLFDRRVAQMIADGADAPPQWAGLKFFNVYGPNEFHKGGQQSVVPQVYRQIKETGQAKLFQSHNPDYPDGGQQRDFIWVGDCVAVMLWLLEHQDVSGLFNCGTGQARSFQDLACAVFAALGLEPKITYVPTPENIRDKYQYFTQAQMERLKRAGYDQGFTSLEDGVGQYVRDYLEQADPFN